jgi:hypothetical protein
MSGFTLKGGLIEFMESFPIPVPNVIIFQYNPETMTHGWTPAAPASPPADAKKPNPLAITGQPQETFSFTLAMDSNDTIADGNAVVKGIAELSGVYSRLAALEMLMFPTAPPGGGLIGSVTAALGGLGGGSSSPTPTQTVPSQQVPTVLFVWGPGRIVPVKVKTLSVTEKLYDNMLLNPIHVEAQITLSALTLEELDYVDGPLGAVAKAANKYSQGLREALAIANLANAVTSIIGMLPV